MNYAGIAIVVFAGCTSFDPIERGICGNGLLEPGEDCDSTDPSCVACAVACTATTDCPTTDYACGVDGFCHAPSGDVAPATAASPLLATDVRISDIDGDGIGDVLALSNTSVVVRFGDAHAALTNSYSTATPAQTGTPAVADFDGDGRLDVAITAADGIVELASPYGTPSPQISRLPLTDSNGVPFSMEAMWPVGATAVGALLSEGDGPMQIGVLSFGDGGPEVLGGVLCDQSRYPRDFALADLDVYNASATDVVVSVPTGTGSARQACVIAIHVNGTTATFTDITPSGPPPQRRLVFANLDFAGSDPCPSLVDSDAGGAGLRVWAGSTSGGHCALAASATTLPPVDNDPSTAAVGHIPVPGIDFVGNDALVLTTGIDLYIFGLPSSTLVPVYASERRLGAVITGDLDNDGNLDAVLSAEGQDDLDVVYRITSNGLPSFIVAHLDTVGVVTAMTIGDFDGNGVNDIAYTEHVLDHDRLSVAYDAPGRTQTAIAQGTLDHAVSLVPFGFPSSDDPGSVVGDLVVLEQQAGVLDPQALSVLEGSPDRTMIAYFDPRPSDDPQPHFAYRGVAAGDFVSATSAPKLPDLVAFVPTIATTGAATTIKMFRLDGTAAGFDPNDPLDRADGVEIGGLAYCEGQVTGTPCIDNSAFVAWPTASAHDVVIGVDRESPPRAFVIDPWAAAPSATPATALTASVPSGAELRSLRAIDLDGDGTLELVAGFGPPADAPASDPGLVIACSVSASGVPTSCTDLGAVAAGVLPGTSCVDAAPGLISFRGPTTPPTAGTELIALCHDSTGDASIVRIDANAGNYTATVVATGLGELRQLVVGDVTGDGVPDIVALQGDAGSRSITVLAQCSSRDLACQQTAVQP